MIEWIILGLLLLVSGYYLKRHEINRWIKSHWKKLTAGAIAGTAIVSGALIMSPPGDDPFESTENLGYELLDNNTVFHMWNSHDSYYFNRSNGIQFSNHYQEYWTTNVMMIGYYAGDQWNLLYRTDELSGFTEVLDAVTDEYINATLWKDLSYGAYDFRLAIRYSLTPNQHNIHIIPHIKNLGIAIPFDIGFGWEMKDIHIDNRYENNYFSFNGSPVLLSDDVDIFYHNIDRNGSNAKFVLYNVHDVFRGKSIELWWNTSLNETMTIKSRQNQYNAPVSFFINAGTLNVNQEKQTLLKWHDSGEVTVFDDVDADFKIYDVKLTNLSNDRVAIAYLYNEDSSMIGKCRIVKIANNAVVHTGNDFAFTSNAILTHNMDVCSIGDNKLAFAYADDVLADDGYTCVAEIDDLNLSGSVGSAVEFETGDMEWPAMAKLDTDKYVISYQDESNSDSWTACACSVSGTTVTKGTPNDVDPTPDYKTYNSFDCDRISTDKFITVIGSVESSYDGYYAVIGTVSGTTISWGTVYNYRNLERYRAGVAVLNESFIYATGSASNPFAILGHISGTDLSFGSDADIIETDHAYTIYEDIRINGSTSAIVYRDSGIGSLDELIILSSRVDYATKTFVHNESATLFDFGDYPPGTVDMVTVNDNGICLAARGEVLDNYDLHYAVFDINISTESGEPPANNAPILSNEYPTDEATGVETTPTLHVDINDLDADPFNITWNSNSSGSWVQFGHNYSTKEWVGVNSGHFCYETGNEGHAAVDALGGTDYWDMANVGDRHVIIDLGDQYTISNTRGRSNTLNDPTKVEVFTSTDNSSWTSHDNVTTWKDTSSWVEYDITDTIGRYMKFRVHTNEGLATAKWGDTASPFTILDVEITDYQYNDTYYQTNSNFSSVGTTYWWSVNVSDGTDWTNETYYFTTADTTLPEITINFAGNLSDTGGPKYIPPNESGTEASDGYYTNDSYQTEDYIYINCTITDDGGNLDASSIWLNWLNGTTWTNWTYSLINSGGNYWEINTSGNITVGPGYDYSFDIVANDTADNSNSTSWNKIGINGVTIRRTVQLGHTDLLDLTYIPLYYFGETHGSGNSNKMDRYHHDQSADGTSHDTGYFRNDDLTDDVAFHWCSGTTMWWYDESQAIEPFTLENIYYHTWHSDNVSGDTTWIYDLQNTKAVAMVGGGGDKVIMESENHSIITYDDGEANTSSRYYLLTTWYDIDLVDNSFVENDIFEMTVYHDTSNKYPGTISNRSFPSFIILNVPDNETLNASHADTDSDDLSDWTELYVYYTDPFLADTDNDGVNDYYETLSGSDPNNYTDTIEYNVAPTITSPYPSNGSTNIETSPTAHITVNDPEGKTMNVSFYNNVSAYDTFGYSGETTNTFTIEAGAMDMHSGLFHNSYTGTLSNITVWIKTGSSEQVLIAAYNTSLDLIAITETKSIDDSGGSNYLFNFTTNPTVAPGDYHMGIFTDGSSTNYKYNTTGGLGRYEDFDVDRTWSDGPPATFDNISMSADDNVYMNVAVTTDEWSLRQTNSSVGNGTYYWNFVEANEHDTKYWWKVVVDDGTNTNSSIYHFTTFSGFPVIESIVPANESTGISVQPIVNVTISHPSGLPMNISFYENSSTESTFGYSSDGPSDQEIFDIWGPVGGNFTSPASSIEIDSITVLLQNSEMSRVTCMIYEDDDSLVTNSQTEVKEINTSGNIEWHTFNITGTKPVLSANTEYFLAAYIENDTNIFFLDSQSGYQVRSGSVLPDPYPTAPSDWASFVYEADGKMSIYATYTEGGDWVHRQTNSSVNDGSYYWTYTQASSGDKTYYYKVNVTDSFCNISEIYHFSTSNTLPTISNPDPANESTGIAYNYGSVTVDIADADGHEMDWTIDVSNGDSDSGTSYDDEIECSLSTLATDTTYTWWVNVTDYFGWTNRSYEFTTEANSKPEIGTITTSSEQVGYGYNVTVNASVWDNETGLSSVKCEVTYPDDSTYNFTMANTVGQYWEKEINLTDTWQLGLHNFTIWVSDGSLTNTSGIENFTVSSDVNVSIQTIEDIFYETDYINLTDPPTHYEYITIDFSDYELRQIATPDGTFIYIDMQDTFTDEQIGTPSIPKKIINLVPYRYRKITNIEIVDTETEFVTLQHQLYPAQLNVPLDEEEFYFIYDESSYEYNGKLIDSLFEEGTISYMRGFPIKTLILHPFDYNPKMSGLFVTTEMTICLTYADFEEYDFNSMFRNDENDREHIKQFVSNSETADDYQNYEIISQLDDPLPLGYTDGLCDPSDNGGEGYDYVLITSDDLNETTGDYDWDDLLTHRETEDNYDTYKITVETIVACADYWNDTAMFNDTQAKIREFIKDAYQDWGIEYVLLGGCGSTENDTRNHVPFRFLWCEYGNWLYYTPGLYPSDVYYSNLDGDWWDATGNESNGCWGGSGPVGDHKDAYGEIKIGRILAYNDSTVSNAVEKIIVHDQVTDTEFLNYSSFWGDGLGWGTSSEDYMEEIRNDSKSYNTLTFADWNDSNPEFEWTTNGIYADLGHPSTFKYDEIDNNKVHIINHLGHGQLYESFGFFKQHWTSRTGTMTMFGITQNCHSGDYNNDGAVVFLNMVNTNNSMFYASIQPTGYGFGSYLSTAGSNQYIHRKFWDYVFNQPLDDWQLGDALLYSHDEISSLSTNYAWAGAWYGTNLFGDPAQKIRNYGGDYDNHPDISNPSVADHAIDVSVDIVNLSVIINDIEGSSMNWSIEITNGDSNSSIGASNGTIHCNIDTSLEYNTTYYWYVNVTDGGNWTNETYEFTTQLSYTESKIDNLGALDSKGYLLISIDYNNSGTWENIEDTIDESTTREVSSGTHLKLDSIFNGIAVAGTNLTSGTGQYRVYAAFRDNVGNVLENTDGTYQNASYEFTYSPDTSPPEIGIPTVSPNPVPYGNDANISVLIWENETELDEPVKCHIYYPDDTDYNFTMLPPTFDTAEQYVLEVNLSTTLQLGQHSFKIWATDGTNTNTTGLYYFNVTEFRNTTIRTNGIDFFTWLGDNTTMSGVAENFTGYTFDGSDEISILGDDGHFINYTSADEGGADDVVVSTFDVIKTNLEDDTGDLEFSMGENSDYTGNYENRTFELYHVGNGYNYTGFSNGVGSTLGAEADAMNLANGYWIALWNETTYSWTVHIQGTPIHADENIGKWAVCNTKISQDRTWDQS